jgi:hypothetical protein
MFRGRSTALGRAVLCEIFPVWLRIGYLGSIHENHFTKKIKNRGLKRLARDKTQPLKLVKTLCVLIACLTGYSFHTQAITANALAQLYPRSVAVKTGLFRLLFGPSMCKQRCLKLEWSRALSLSVVHRTM